MGEVRRYRVCFGDKKNSGIGEWGCLHKVMNTLNVGELCT